MELPAIHPERISESSRRSPTGAPPVIEKKIAHPEGMTVITILAPVFRVQSQISIRTGGCAALTTGYLLKPLRGKPQQAFVEYENCGVTMLGRISHMMLRRA